MRELTITDSPKTAFAMSKEIDIEAFAKDMVLYGAGDYAGVLVAHKVTVEEAEILAQSPIYIATVRGLRTHLATSPYAKVRLKALDYLDVQLGTLNAQMLSEDAPLSDLVKGIKVLAELANVVPTPTENNNTPQGATLVVNIGGRQREATVIDVTNE